MRAPPVARDDHQLLAFVGVDAAMLDAAGGLRRGFDDPCDLSCAVLLSREDRARVRAVLELPARWTEGRLKREGPLTSPAHTSRYLEARLRGRADEVFAVIFFDNRHRVIEFKVIEQAGGGRGHGAAQGTRGCGAAASLGANRCARRDAGISALDAADTVMPSVSVATGADAAKTRTGRK